MTGPRRPPAPFVITELVSFTEFNVNNKSRLLTVSVIAVKEFYQ